MKIINRLNGKIEIKPTKETELPWPTNRDYAILNKIYNIENYFFKLAQKYKFSLSLNKHFKFRASWNAIDLMRKYKKKIDDEKMSPGEYFYFNLQKEKKIIKDLKNATFDSCNRLTDCQFNYKINQLESKLSEL
ncbi:hypothetical protein GW932_00860 [archaeon]|nr:hypothetical protein [archaeon]